MPSVCRRGVPAVFLQHRGRGRGQAKKAQQAGAACGFPGRVLGPWHLLPESLRTGQRGPCPRRVLQAELWEPGAKFRGTLCFGFKVERLRPCPRELRTDWWTWL